MDQTDESHLKDASLLSPALVARMLSGSLGESEMVWSMRLANWRRPDRTGPLPVQENSKGKPGYWRSDVVDFMTLRLSERKAIAPAASDKKTARATAVADVEGDTAFIRVMWNARTAQGMFSIDAEGAKQLAARLNQAVAKVAHIQQERAA